ncbi:MAG: hypothetical protein EA342_11040 [Leptolyngbya sp. LCM1.Bin17]|nr:MAG: hypothetical protein EA342_11040 [Leptolyngbya sp. LCM1.Bin17]
MQAQAFSILATLALVLMVVVTGGVIYLTAADWRDRRRRKRDQDATKATKAKASSKRAKSTNKSTKS